MQSTKERLLVAVARYAKGKKGRLVGREFCRGAGVTDKTVRCHFAGGFEGLLKSAGLGHREHRRANVPEGELMAEVHRLAVALGRRPTWEEIEREGKFSSGMYYTRYRRMGEILARYEKWRREHAPGAAVLSGEVRKGPRAAPSGLALAGSASSPAGGGGGRRRGVGAARAGEEDFATGAPLSFRGVMHEPTSESGVVHLFGVLGAELGYAVVSIRSGYPDCLAYVRESSGRWRKVRIEFELRSSNFRLHGHDPKGCDRIVCWEDDWEGCPVKVVALKRELERVRGMRESA